MKPILEIKNVSKKFRIGHEQRQYLDLRDSITSLFRFSKTTTEDFYSLRDVSFNVEAGQTIGIIGRNGAGKSTLLKILSKITPPTSGKIISRGRVASLLEVGTGFHPELTGRENIFLNGSILGMKHREIVNKYDEIVDFSGVEKFLDTPLKHYSSGMKLRLAFAVAAFLDPEILVIDEVLAVGDAEFQRKCMGKMQEVGKGGRTILFVSHNMEALSALCENSILLDKGELVYSGKSRDVIAHYLERGYSHEHTATVNFKENSIIQKITMLGDGMESSVFNMGSKVSFRLWFEYHNPIRYPVFGIIIKDFQNNCLLGVNNKHYCDNLVQSPVKKGMLELTIPFLPLLKGDYSADVFLGDGSADIQAVKDAIHFSVNAKHFNTSPLLPELNFNKFFIPDLQWKFEASNG